MKSSLLQSPLGKTPPCGEGGINKVPFLSYKSLLPDKAQRNQVCCSLRVLVLCSGQLVHLCGTVGCGTSGEPKGSIQASGWAVSGSDFGGAAALGVCMHLPTSSTSSLGSLSAGKLTFWMGVSREPPAHIWWVTRGSRGLPLCWQCWGSWVGWGSDTGQCCWHCWCWHWSLKMSSCWEWRWSPPASRETETRYLRGCCQTCWCAKVSGWWMSGGTHSCHHFGSSSHGFQTSLQLSVRETERVLPLWVRCARAPVFSCWDCSWGEKKVRTKVSISLLGGRVRIFLSQRPGWDFRAGRCFSPHLPPVLGVQDRLWVQEPARCCLVFSVQLQRNI